MVASRRAMPEEVPIKKVLFDVIVILGSGVGCNVVALPVFCAGLIARQFVSGDLADMPVGMLFVLSAMIGLCGAPFGWRWTVARIRMAHPEY